MPAIIKQKFRYKLDKSPAVMKTYLCLRRKNSPRMDTSAFGPRQIENKCACPCVRACVRACVLVRQLEPESRMEKSFDRFAHRKKMTMRTLTAM